jgi:molecular chaperone GrpE
MEREWSDRVKLAGERVIADILPVLDTFDKALDDAKNNGDAKSLRKGLESIHRQLVQALQREGLRDIRTDGDFDPFMHEAMMREETAEGRDGRVLEVFQKGYTLGPKVIRTAKVKVSTRKEAGGSQCHDHPKSEGTADEQKETEE